MSFLQECLEARVTELEKALEAEKKLVQREKLTAARLQRQLSRVSDRVEYFSVFCRIALNFSQYDEDTKWGKIIREN